MTDNSTNLETGIADRFPGLPSFVRQIRDYDGSQDTADCFDHWSPLTVTGHGPTDWDLGRQHCQAAMAYSRQIGSATFLLYVLMSIHGRPAGNIEHGFIAELISPALNGRVPPIVPESNMQELAATGADIAALRAGEAFMARALRGSSSMPDLFYGYVLELISSPRDCWIGAAVYMLAGAALNGSLH